jgi:hypothetical protein
MNGRSGSANPGTRRFLLPHRASAWRAETGPFAEEPCDARAGRWGSRDRAGARSPDEARRTERPVQPPLMPDSADPPCSCKRRNRARGPRAAMKNGVRGPVRSPFAYNDGGCGISWVEVGSRRRPRSGRRSVDPGPTAGLRQGIDCDPAGKEAISPTHTEQGLFDGQTHRRFHAIEQRLSALSPQSARVLLCHHLPIEGQRVAAGPVVVRNRR